VAEMLKIYKYSPKTYAPIPHEKVQDNYMMTFETYEFEACIKTRALKNECGTLNCKYV